MEDLIGKAHAYLDNKGCKSMGQQYTAFEIEKMLADFAQQQLNLLNIPAVSSRSFAKKVSGDGVFFKCSNCSFEPEMESKTDDLLSMNYCPKCQSETENVIICDNDCGTIICGICGIEYRIVDGILFLDHSPACGEFSDISSDDV